MTKHLCKRKISPKSSFFQSFSHSLGFGIFVVALGFAQSKERVFKYAVHDMTRPQPAIVTPGPVCISSAPSDAIVLFDGKDLSAWSKAGSDAPAGWSVKDGIVTIAAGSGNIATRQSFGDCQVHIEWMVPTELKCESQHGCNSGLFFILDMKFKF